jgi:TetR/AcrR family transcriptional regulator, mexJK operon transcriptional repressor
LTDRGKAIIRRDAETVTARILDAAQEEFMRAGYSQANTNRMARDYGISKATIFKHFQTKQELFEAVITRIAERWHAAIDWPSIEADDPETWLNRFGTSALARLLEPDALFVSRNAITEGWTYPEIRQIWPRLATRPIVELLASKLSTWADAGLIKAESSENLARAYLDLAFSGEVSRALYAAASAPSQEDISRHVGERTALFLRGCSVAS